MAQHIINSDGTRPGGFLASDGEFHAGLPEPRFETEVHIDSGRGYPHRFGVGLVPPGHAARQRTGGPLVPGPWAFTYGLASVLSAEPMPEAPSITAEWGDTIILDSIPFVILPGMHFGRRDPRWADLVSPEAAAAEAVKA